MLRELPSGSLFVRLVADGWCSFVLREKYCWLIGDDWFILREKYCWLVDDKTNEQGAELLYKSYRYLQLRSQAEQI
jgi:hypothetical protein